MGNAWIKEVIILKIHPDRFMSMLLGWINRRDTKIRALKGHRHIDIQA